MSLAGAVVSLRNLFSGSASSAAAAAASSATEAQPATGATTRAMARARANAGETTDMTQAEMPPPEPAPRRSRVPNRRGGAEASSANPPPDPFDFYNVRLDPDDAADKNEKKATEEFFSHMLDAEAKRKDVSMDEKTDEAVRVCRRIFNVFYQTKKHFEKRNVVKEYAVDCVCKLCITTERIPITYHTAGNRVWFMDLEVKSIERPGVLQYISELAFVNASATDVFHRFVFHKPLHPHYAEVSKHIETHTKGVLKMEPSPWDDTRKSEPFANAIWTMLKRIPCRSLIISNGLAADPSRIMDNISARCTPEVAVLLLNRLERKKWKWMPLEKIKSQFLKSMYTGDDGEYMLRMTENFGDEMFKLKKSLRDLVEQEFMPDKERITALTKLRNTIRKIEDKLTANGKTGWEKRPTITVDDIGDKLLNVYRVQYNLVASYRKTEIDTELENVLRDLYTDQFEYKCPSDVRELSRPSGIGIPDFSPIIVGKTKYISIRSGIRVMPILRLMHIQFAGLTAMSRMQVAFHSAEVDVICKLQVTSCWMFVLQVIAHAYARVRKPLLDFLTRDVGDRRVTHRLMALVYICRQFLSDQTCSLTSGLLKLSPVSAAVLYAQFYEGVLFVNTNRIVENSNWALNAPIPYPFDFTFLRFGMRPVDLEDSMVKTRGRKKKDESGQVLPVAKEEKIEFKDIKNALGEVKLSLLPSKAVQDMLNEHREIQKSRNTKMYMLQKGKLGEENTGRGILQYVSPLPEQCVHLPYWIGSYMSNRNTKMDANEIGYIHVHHMWCLHFYDNAARMASLEPSKSRAEAKDDDKSSKKKKSKPKSDKVVKMDLSDAELNELREANFSWTDLKKAIDTEQHQKALSLAIKWYALLDYGRAYSRYTWCKNCKRYDGDPPRVNNEVMQEYMKREAEETKQDIPKEQTLDVSMHVTEEELEQTNAIDERMARFYWEGYCIPATGLSRDEALWETSISEMIVQKRKLQVFQLKK